MANAHNHPPFEPICPERVVGKCLVVIDPEDREQVEQLAICYAAVASARLGDEYLAWDNRSTDARNRIAADLAAALRSLIPPPRPPEPLGLGAVVEDDKGVRYVHAPESDGDRCPWVRYGVDAFDGETGVRWSRIAAVRILSEGVQ